MGDLDPRGTIYFPSLAPKIVERFGFLKFPQVPTDFDEAKGIEFTDGYIDGASVDRIKIYSNGIQVDTRASTDESIRLLDETLTWLKGEVGLVYEFSMIKRWGYLSNVAFYSDANFDLLHPALVRLCQSVSQAVSKIKNTPFEYRNTGINLSFDRTLNPVTMANFSIQRRANVTFPENKYFSESPLPTDLHLKFLEEFEAEVMGKGDAGPATELPKRIFNFQE